ncbi:hypothetical protein PWY87_29510 [Kribbella solani]|uniref:hypothetical protein n=1 Tax=Kribbella solani TaxID=236067 RepID=UPI0029BC1227|nr:hypothetical protein [Kribbella solani]MDX3005853.1 hypothetical protein [Kribbella solani]
MPGDAEGRKHITAALGGRALAPLSAEERIEREQVRDLIQAVASCYNSLVSRAAGRDATNPDAEGAAGRDDEVTAALAARLAFYDGEFRRRDSMTAFERAEVIRRYPDLLAELRAELDR